MMGELNQMLDIHPITDGFKETEVGVIPEDWDICELQTAVDFLDGQRRPIKSGDRAKISGLYPYYGASGIVDYVNDYIFDDDLILLGEDGENILSRNLPLAFMVSGKIWVNNHAHVMKPKDSFDITYLTEYLESIDYSLLNSGTAQPKLNKQACLKIKVIKPSKKEQTAIAKVLSDADALITKIEQLIAKKQAIKTATMQQLLSGRTRLPPFAKHPNGTFKGYRQNEQGVLPEDWGIVSVADVLSEISMGPFGSDIKVSNFTKTGIPVLSGLNVNSSKLIDSFKNFVTEEKAKELKKAVASRGDVIVTHRGTIGQISYIPDNSKFEKYVISQSQFRARFKKEINPAWVVLYFLSPKGSSSLLEGKGHTGVPAIAQATTTFRKLQFPCPSNEEQTAITNILSDMDAELATLEKKLAKLRDIKQGMMRQLLTGRIRLPLDQQP
nr:restriction endonuclease subunit S [Citrobacter werkmanii]